MSLFLSIAFPAPYVTSSLFLVLGCSALTGVISPATRSLIAVKFTMFAGRFWNEKYEKFWLRLR